MQRRRWRGKAGWSPSPDSVRCDNCWPKRWQRRWWCTARPHQRAPTTDGHWKFASTNQANVRWPVHRRAVLYYCGWCSGRVAEMRLAFQILVCQWDTSIDPTSSAKNAGAARWQGFTKSYPATTNHTAVALPLPLLMVGFRDGKDHRVPPGLYRVPVPRACPISQASIQQVALTDASLSSPLFTLSNTPAT